MFSEGNGSKIDHKLKIYLKISISRVIYLFIYLFINIFIKKHIITIHMIHRKNTKYTRNAPSKLHWT